jgi:hypothetical protein
MGILEAYVGGTVYMIEGNTSDPDNGIMVRDNHYSDTDWKIMGHCRNCSGSPGVVPSGSV